jgi:predicted RNA-binding protein with RPS1 domain
LEYLRQKKSEISLDSLEAFLGRKLERRNIYGIQVGDQLFGVSSEDELKSFLKLKILADLKEARIAGDQRTIVMEGENASIGREKEGDIFISIERENYYALQKETVSAGQGIEVKVARVTENNEILLTIRGKLENIEEVPEITRTGQAIWINRRNVNTTVILKNYQTISIGTLTRKISRKVKGISRREKEEDEIETIFLLTANVVGTEKPKVVKIDKRAEKFFKKIKEKKLVKKPKNLGVGVGCWFGSDDDSILVGEVQLFLSKDKKWRLFGGGGKKERGYISYYGLKYGDLLNIGIGGMNSDALAETMVIGGLTIGTEKVKLESDYLFLPNTQKGRIRVSLVIRF